MFRKVILPDNIPGRLYLTSMPGRLETIGDFEAAIDRLAINRVVCLTPFDEVREKSKDYYNLILSEKHIWQLEHFPIPDFGIPDDQTGFLNLTKKMADSLISGENVIVHCTAGIGRTGTFAMILLMVLGMNRTDAAAAVRMAGAQPEGINQQDFINWCTGELHYYKPGNSTSFGVSDTDHGFRIRNREDHML